MPELPLADEGKAAYSFSLQPTQEFVPRNWLHHWHYDDGEIYLLFARDGDTFYLRFPEAADFRIVPSRGEISCCTVPGITDNTVRHLLLDQVLPRIVGHEGSIVLHASAISVAEQAILFMGGPWSGKSTLAANFINHGANMLADDCVLLEMEGSHVSAITNYPGSRLWQDSLDALQDRSGICGEITLYSTKKRLLYRWDRQKKYEESLPVNAIFLLGPAVSMTGNDHISIRRMSGSRVIPELLKYTFVLDVVDKDKVKGKFHAHGSIALSIPLYQLDYPRDYSMLGEVFSAVNGVLSGTTTASSNIQ